ncbi:hypothetical protein N9064_01310, partial [bacterium]|nr:hypothetical protein [bacterium]
AGAAAGAREELLLREGVDVLFDATGAGAGAGAGASFTSVTVVLVEDAILYPCDTYCLRLEWYSTLVPKSDADSTTVVADI